MIANPLISMCEQISYTGADGIATHHVGSCCVENWLFHEVKIFTNAKPKLNGLEIYNPIKFVSCSY